MGRSFPACYCTLCGKVIGRPRSPFVPLVPFHSVARGLSLDGRWTRAGYNSGACALEPMQFGCDDAWDLDDPDPDRDPSTWDGMAGLDGDLRVTFRTLERPWNAVAGFPFHSVCAKWLDAQFQRLSIRRVSLAAYLLSTSKRYSYKWEGDHRNCPDDADVESSQLHAPHVLRKQFYVLARFDSSHSQAWAPFLARLNGGSSPAGASAQDDNCDDEDEDPKLKEENRGFAGTAASLRRLSRGTYEGAARLVPLPAVGRLRDGGAATALRFAPDRLPHDVIAAVAEQLPVERRECATGAIALLSSSRSWYHHGRERLWKYFCGRDGFARVPTQSVAESLAAYEARGVDWKRVYFCYESRNARRIARNLEFLADRARRAETTGVDESWSVTGRNPLLGPASDDEEEPERVFF
ncbi:hypothetical protein DFJ73DRAFT_817515 [Zopfochytrium polystomum]|nr:hypothetical protein DFJ73DRAFT_817515 [Zopfochytrium polystomum]